MVLNAGRYVVIVLRQHNRLLHSPDRTKTHARVTGGCWHLMMQTLRQEDPKSIQRATIPIHSQTPKLLGCFELPAGCVSLSIDVSIPLNICSKAEPVRNATDFLTGGRLLS